VVDAEVAHRRDMVLGRMLGEHLEAIVLRRFQDDDHRVVHHIGNGATVFSGFALDEISAGERHGGFLQACFGVE
jgi:hypothetical protein